MVSTNLISPSNGFVPIESLLELPTGEGRDSRGYGRRNSNGHSHPHFGPLDLDMGEVGRTWIVLGATVGVPVLATIIGLFVLWPDKSSLISSRSFTAESGPMGKATIISTDLSGRQNSVSALTEASGVRPEEFARGHVRARITEGGGEDPAMPVQPVGELCKLVRAGNRLVVLYSSQTTLSDSPYSFIDYQRRPPAGALAVVYLALVVAAVERKGILSVLGLLMATGVFAFFVIPTLLADSYPLAVTLVGSTATMLAIACAAHGVPIHTTTVLLGTMTGIVLIALLVLRGTDTTHLSGDVDKITRLPALCTHIDLQMLLIRGMVIVGLGVPSDAIITQASPVQELHAASPLLSRIRLFIGGMGIGWDHIALIVCALVFAYVGTTLPFILAATLIDRAVLDTIFSGEIIEEIVRTLIPPIGLVLAIPMTTAIAAALCHVTPVLDE